MAIRAFIGHSFTHQDAEVVDKFLKFFATVSQLGIGFTWEHARSAEPKEVAEKVLELIKDKNTFIGICTKKELVVDATKLDQPFWSKAKYIGPVEHFYWKTSDWLIQEIGLAVGRGMHVILLVERGIRPPGSFQGNLEYIDFDRNAVDASFERLLQMLRSISSVPQQVLQVASEQTPKPEKPEVENKPEAADPLVPTVGWKNKDYEFAAFIAIMDNKDEELARIDAAYKSSSLYEEGVVASNWEATLELTKIAVGKGGDLVRLQELAATPPKTPEKLASLAAAYSYRKLSDKSAEAYEAAAEVSTNSAQKMNYLRKAALEHARRNQKSSIDKNISAMREIVAAEADLEKSLLTAMKDIAEITEDSDLRIASMERLLQLEPQDDEVRFSLAYLYGEQENAELSLFHYQAIPAHLRTAVAWNNLGVAYNQLGMPCQAVGAYEEAIKLKETLAMSNLALKYLSAGFKHEAGEQIEKALLEKDRHKNVASTMSRISEVQDEEGKKLKEVEEQSRPLSDFYRELGRAAIGRLPAQGRSNWKGPEWELTVNVVGNTFTGAGTYEVKSLGALGIALLGNQSGTSQEVRRTYKISFVGTVVGRMVVAQVSRSSDEGYAVSLLSGNQDGRALMFFSDDGSQISVFEKTLSSGRKMYDIKKIVSQ